MDVFAFLLCASFGLASHKNPPQAQLKPAMQIEIDGTHDSGSDFLGH